MIETKTKEIGGTVFQCTQWSGSKNFSRLYELASVIAPTMAHGIRPGVSIFNAEVNVAGAMDTLVMSLGDSDKAFGLILRLLDGVHVDNRPINKTEFDLLFVGPALFDLPKLLLFVVETNFGDFSGLVRVITTQFGVRKNQAPLGATPTSEPGSAKSSAES